MEAMTMEWLNSYGLGVGSEELGIRSWNYFAFLCVFAREKSIPKVR